jgi:hypothetical protein
VSFKILFSAMPIMQMLFFIHHQKLRFDRTEMI